MNTHENDTGIVAALARAQAEMPPIPKAHTNPHFGSRYADIADVLAVVRPVLARHGIAIVQPIELDADGRAHLVTRLLHGAEQIESRLPLTIDQKAQDLGSRLTYLRRYALAALVGVAAEDDDDGNAASAAPPRTRPKRDDHAAPRHDPAARARAHASAKRTDTPPAATSTSTTPTTTRDRRMARLFVLLEHAGVAEDDRHQWAAGWLRRPVTTFGTLSDAELELLIAQAAAEADLSADDDATSPTPPTPHVGAQRTCDTCREPIGAHAARKVAGRLVHAACWNNEDADAA